MVSAPPLPRRCPRLPFVLRDWIHLVFLLQVTLRLEGLQRGGDKRETSLFCLPPLFPAHMTIKKNQHNFPSSVSPLFPSYLHVSRLVALPVIPRWWHLEKTCAITLLDIVSSPRANSSAVISRISRCPFIEMIEIWQRDSPGRKKGEIKQLDGNNLGFEQRRSDCK